MKFSMLTLIAMWLWCTAAAGEILPVAVQALEQNSHGVTLTPPCNWDKNLDNVAVNAVYAHPGRHTDVRSYSVMDRGSIVNVPIRPMDIKVEGNQLTVAFDPNLPKIHDGRFLYHLNVEVGTRNQKCKEGFGFGSLTRPR